MSVALLRDKLVTLCDLHPPEYRRWRASGYFVVDGAATFLCYGCIRSWGLLPFYRDAAKGPIK